MNSCKIETYVVKRAEPRTKYKDYFFLHVYEQFKQEGPNTWKGKWGPYNITVIQRERYHEVKEEDIEITKNPSFKGEIDMLYAFPSATEIADALNKHLDKIYG